MIVDRTGDLIECGEKNGKEDVEERKSVSAMDGREEGKNKYGQ